MVWKINLITSRGRCAGLALLALSGLSTPLSGCAEAGRAAVGDGMAAAMRLERPAARVELRAPEATAAALALASRQVAERFGGWLRLGVVRGQEALASSPARASATLPVEGPKAQLGVVYFDLASARLSEAARAKLADLASKAGDGAVVEIVGHADRAGAAGANRMLSARRAEAVRAAIGERLEARFKMQARGEATPAVPTRDGVAEARNRRVEIRIRPVILTL